MRSFVRVDADATVATNADVESTTAHLISYPSGAPAAMLPPPACHTTVALPWPVAVTDVIEGREGAALPDAVDTEVYTDQTLQP